MGENLAVPGRRSVRTPMQWTAEANGGFSTARASRLPRRPPEGRFGPLAVNVADQRRDPASLLSWMERAIRRRRETPELGWGSWTVLRSGDAGVLAHRTDWEGRGVVCLHNLAEDPRAVAIALDEPEGTVALDLLDGHSLALEDGRLALTLEGWGYRWYRLHRPGDRGLT